jgi:hypothetical protein
MATGQVAESVVEGVAEGLEEAAQTTRQLNTDFLGGFGAGLIIGFAVGFYFGHRWNKEKIRAEEIKRADEEVVKIREVLQERYALREKPDLDEVVEEKGYVVTTEERPLKPPVPVLQSPSPTRSPISQDKSKDEGWDYGREIAERSPNHPYIIHQDEFNADHPGYQQLAWTYWGGDNILADEHEQTVERPELVVGLECLSRFGHGADDPNAVFVRNDKLEIEFEITRVLNKSYVEEVQGLDLDNPVVDDDDNNSS